MKHAKFLLIIFIFSFLFYSCNHNKVEPELLKTPASPPENQKEWTAKIHTTIPVEEIEQILGVGKYEKYIEKGYEVPYPCYVMKNEDFIKAYSNGTSFRDMISTDYKIFFPKGELVDAYNQKNGEWILDENQSYLNKIPNQEVNKYLSNLSEFTDNDLTIIYITFPANSYMCFPVHNMQAIYIASTLGEFIIPCYSRPPFSSTIYTINDFMSTVIESHNNFLKNLDENGNILYG